jgi:hypothetical protein
MAFESIRQAAADRGAADRKLIVLIAGSPNDLGAPLLTLWSIRDGLRLDVRELRRVPEPRSNNPETVEAAALRLVGGADLVLVGESGTGLVRVKLVTQGADEYYLGIARMHPGLERIAQVIAPGSGKIIEIYGRRGGLPREHGP